MINLYKSYKQSIDPGRLGAHKSDIVIFGNDKSHRSQLINTIFSANKNTIFDINLTLPSHENYFQVDHKIAIASSAWLNEKLNGISFFESNCRLIFDITGIPDILIYQLFKLVKDHRILNRCRFLYVEPIMYSQRENTVFYGTCSDILPIPGYSSSMHTTVLDNDLLTISLGYESDLPLIVSQHKEYSTKQAIVSLPSFSIQMYQESLVKTSTYFEQNGMEMKLCPAYDPLTFASMVKEIFHTFPRLQPHSNLYLSVLGPKPHSLGACLIWNCLNSVYNFSLLSPRERNCYFSTSSGHGRVWEYFIYQ